MAFFRFVLFFALLAAILTAAAVGVIVLFGKGGTFTLLNEQGAGAADIKRFHDRELGISFTYPRAWESAYLGPKMVRFSGERSTMILAVTEMKEEYTLEEYTKKNLQEMTENAEHDGFTLVLEESLAVLFGGHEGHRISALLGKDEQVLRATQLWNVIGKKAYSLSFSAPLGQYDDAVQAFENVIQSLRIRQ